MEDEVKVTLDVDSFSDEWEDEEDDLEWEEDIENTEDIEDDDIEDDEDTEDEDTEDDGWVDIEEDEDIDDIEDEDTEDDGWVDIEEDEDIETSSIVDTNGWDDDISVDDNTDDDDIEDIEDEDIEDEDIEDEDTEDEDTEDEDTEDTEDIEDIEDDGIDLDTLSLEELRKLAGEDEDTYSDEDGTVVTSIEETEDTDSDDIDIYTDFNNSFISDSGDIVVMDNSGDSEDNFIFKYIDIEKIAVVRRIRDSASNISVLVKSIKSTGLLEPLVVAPTETKDYYVLLAGFRRILACAKLGKRRIPCIVNTKVNAPDIPVLEALYNHSKSYTIKEIVDYIDYLEKEKGILSASMIEYILQLNDGDYTKLKDILVDNDEEIVDKLYNGEYNIETAFKKLESRRKKEGKDERELKNAAKVYENTKASGMDTFENSGETVEEDAVELSPSEVENLHLDIKDIDNVESDSLDELVEQGNNIEGFEPHKQDPNHREILDPVLRKTVLARDNNTCQICKQGGAEFVDVLDVHHIDEVYLGGTDDIDNLLTTCTVCHKLIHLYGRGQLHIRPYDQFDSIEEVNRFKRIVKLGNHIREGMRLKHMKVEELKKVDKAETIGRTKPGTGQIAT